MGFPANKIILELAGNGDTKISVKDSEWGLSLFENKLYAIDTCILFPTILPRHRRNAKTLFEFSDRIPRRPPKYSSRKRNLYFSKRKQIKELNKCIELVNLLEEGKFKENGMFFVITDAVFQELRTYDGMLGDNNVRDWRERASVKNYCYQLSLNVPLMRSKFKLISKMFDEIGDFSLAITSLILGIDLVTRDYRSFSIPTRKRFQEMFDSRWKGRRSFEFYDVDSFLMILKDRRHLAHANYKKFKAETSSGHLDQAIARDSIPKQQDFSTLPST